MTTTSTYDPFSFPLTRQHAVRDPSGTPVSSVVTKGSYDAVGQRVRKVVEENLLGTWTRTKETRYLGGLELQLKFVGGSLNHERETLHVMDDTRRVALIETDTVDDGDAVATPTPLLRYQFDNHLRSACVETNATGEVISYEEFHPYGPWR